MLSINTSLVLICGKHLSSQVHFVILYSKDVLAMNVSSQNVECMQFALVYSDSELNNSKMQNRYRLTKDT
jgi:hypothetical protein